MQIMIKKTSAAILAVLAFMFLIFTAASSHAVPFYGHGKNDSFTGKFSFDSSSITINLKNTSNYQNITAFAFNIPEKNDSNIHDSISEVGFHANGNNNFELFKGKDVIFNQNLSFLLGASSTNNNSQAWNGGGNPNGGLGFEEEATFKFDFKENFLDGLVINDFIEQDYWLGVRFRGEESEVLHAAPVPEPATMLLLGSGLLILAAFGRKRIITGAKTADH